jgi:hypothetical protein
MSVASSTKWFTLKKLKKRLFQPDRYRYALCAEDMCFKNFFSSEIFKLGKALPIKRGGGIEQEV